MDFVGRREAVERDPPDPLLFELHGGGGGRGEANASLHVNEFVGQDLSAGLAIEARVEQDLITLGAAAPTTPIAIKRDEPQIDGRSRSQCTPRVPSSHDTSLAVTPDSEAALRARGVGLGGVHLPHQTVRPVGRRRR